MREALGEWDHDLADRQRLEEAPERRRRRCASHLGHGLIAGAPTALRSVAELEGFPETYDPLYFIIKASTLLLALLALLQALLDALRPAPLR